MNFEQWWGEQGYEDNPAEKAAARKVWDEWESHHKKTLTLVRKEHQRASALRDALKRTMTIGCRDTGRCRSHRVNENYCRVCRPGMNMLSEFELSSPELMKVIFAPECPVCKGVGTITPKGMMIEPGGLPGKECFVCKGHGSIKSDDD